MPQKPVSHALHALLLSCVLLGPALAAGDPLDWPHWRGPEMNGISRETGLVDSWNESGDTLLWKNEELGSRSTPIVMNGRIYTILRDEPASAREGEKVVCADAKTGEIIWEHRFNVFLSDVPDTRVGWSSIVGDPESGNVFALGVADYFLCLNGETGEKVWSHSLSEEYGMLNTYGGRTNFPLVHEDLVIVSGVIIGWGDKAKPSHRFIAFDKRNGQPVWYESTRLLPDDTTYSAPVLAVIEGQLQMIFGAGDGSVYSFQPRTGKQIWKFDASLRGINTTPVVVGNMVVMGQSEENLDAVTMGSLFALDATRTGDITRDGAFWYNKEMYVGKSAPLVVNDRVYAVEDGGTLLVVDLKTGERIARQKIGTQGRSSPLYADGKIFLCEANGRCYILEPTEDGVEIKERSRISGEVHGSPIVSHGIVYLPTSEALYAFGKKDAEPQTEPAPEQPEESPVAEDTKPAQVLLVPCEAVLTGVQKQQYQVRLYNAKGQFLKMAKPEEVEFSLSGPGAIDRNGKYSPPEDVDHSAVIVTAKVGELSREARVRLFPDLPWSFDFSAGEVPVTWVGMRYRNVVVDFDLLQKLQQESPMAGKVYIYVTSSFVNQERPALKFDDSTPQQGWTTMLRYLDLLEVIDSLDRAKQEIGPALELLKREGVVKSAEWSELPGVGIQLAVERGPRKIDGNAVMCKITTIPKGARSQGWIGPATYSDYSVQADVFGASTDLGSADRQAKMPDIGVTAQRYRLDMMGASQKLRLYSWIAHEIKFKDVPFEWNADQWYTMKLEATSEERDGTTVAVLRGKVWPRGEAEPEAWTIEWTDEPGDSVGSPGLFGNAKDAEVFFDNVQVKSR